MARKALVIYNMVSQSKDFAKLEGQRDEKGAHERWTGKGSSKIFMEEQERMSMYSGSHGSTHSSNVCRQHCSDIIGSSPTSH